MIFQRYRLPSSNPVPSSLNPPDPYHTFNILPPCPRLSVPVPRFHILATATLLDLNTNLSFFSVTIHGPLLRLRLRTILTLGSTSPQHSGFLLLYCACRKSPFHHSNTSYHARCTPSRHFADAAPRPRQVFTNILHLQYYPRYMACPILYQSDGGGTSAFVLSIKRRPSQLLSRLDPPHPLYPDFPRTCRKFETAHSTLY
jgi:hypothetical protein